MNEARDYILKLNTLWSDMISNGMNDPLVNITQLSYLIFLKKIDLIQQRKEATALLFEMDVPDPIFGPLDESCRWNLFKTYSPDKMFRNMTDKVLPFVKYSLKITEDTSYAKYLKNSAFSFTNPEIFKKAVDTLDSIDFENRSVSIECYDHLLSMIKPNSEKGQFRTPAHLVDMMVALTAPGIHDRICDPASGTGSFLVSAAKSISEKYSSDMIDQNVRTYFERDMFSGFDFDASMTEIAAMNLSLAGVNSPNLQTMDSLSANNNYTEEFSVILSNPPFSITTDPDYISESLQSGHNTTNTAVLFFRLLMRMLKSEGRCAAIIPDNLLFGVHKANIALRQDLMENHRVDAIISLSDPNVPYFGKISCSVILFTKDVPDGTDRVWYYDLNSSELVPDLINRFYHKENEESRTRFDNSFFVSSDEIIENNYMLIIDRYKKDLSLPTHDDLKTAVQNLEIANNILKSELFKLDTLR